MLKKSKTFFNLFPPPAIVALGGFLYFCIVPFLFNIAELYRDENNYLG